MGLEIADRQYRLAAAGGCALLKKVDFLPQISTVVKVGKGIAEQQRIFCSNQSRQIMKPHDFIKCTRKDLPETEAASFPCLFG